MVSTEMADFCRETRGPPVEKPCHVLSSSSGMRHLYKSSVNCKQVNWDSAVGTASCYGLGGAEFKFRWGHDFPHSSRLALEPTQPLYNGYRVSFHGVKRSGRGVEQPPISSAEVKERVGLYL